MKARIYQGVAVDRTIESFERHASALVVMATGLGKTVVFSLIAQFWGVGRVLVLVHREELARQAAEKLFAVTGQQPSIEMGIERDGPAFGGLPKVVVASVQSLSRPRRLRRFKPRDFGLIIIDEAHHAVSGSYRDILNYFRLGLRDESGAVLVEGNANLKVLGVTATPQRADKFALGQVFETVAFDYGIEPAIEDGWLVPVRQKVVTVEGLDFSHVREIGGDLSESELERIVTQEGPLHRMAAPAVDLAGDRQALVFCVTVRHAEMLAKVIDRYKQKSVEWLSGETDPTRRREVVEAYKRGDVQILCNCGLFLEGFDAPATSVVVMARPTLSLTLYTQVLGRGTRPLPGIVDGINAPEDRRAAILSSGKTYMDALDFVGNSGRHRIIQAADVLGGKWGMPVRNHAKDLAGEETEEGRPPAPVEQLLERASDELAFLAEEAELDRLRHVTAKAEYSTESVSPFGGTAGPAVHMAKPASPPKEPATTKQRGLLKSLGVPWEDSAKYSKKQAGVIIDKLQKKKKATA